MGFSLIEDFTFSDEKYKVYVDKGLDSVFICDDKDTIHCQVDGKNNLYVFKDNKSIQIGTFYYNYEDVCEGDQWKIVFRFKDISYDSLECTSSDYVLAVIEVFKRLVNAEIVKL